MVNNITVSAIQLTSSGNKEENLEKVDKFIEIAVSNKSKLIALPEVFNIITTPDKEYNVAESIPGPTINHLALKAKQNKIYFLAGSVLEISNTNKSYNTSVLINPDGEIIAKYRKIHLFDTTLTRKESDTRLAGNEIVTCSTELSVFGFSICYDLRFPELYRKLGKQGAQIIFVPSAFILHTGKDHWETLLRARAIENQVFIIAPNQFGKAPETGTVNYGRSSIIDPWGNVIARAYDKECVITAELEMGLIDDVKIKLGFK